MAPALIIIAGILIPGVINALLQSLGYYPALDMREVTFKYYKQVLSDKDFLISLKFSLLISLTSSCLALVFGTALAYSVYRSTKRKTLEKLIFKLPIIVPHTIVAAGVFSLLSQSGLLPRFLYQLGIIKEMEQMPLLLFDRFGIGIVVTYLWKEIPFIAMTGYTILININKDLSLAARNLGANKRQVFFHVLLPLCGPALLSAFIIIFAFSFGAFEVPYLLGPTFPKPLPVKAYMEYTSSDLSSRPYAMVVNILLTCISILLIYLYEKTFVSDRRQKR